jgi:2-iminobutanoate/2-iminopropanoate deaminase
MTTAIEIYNPDTIWHPRGAYPHVARVRGATEVVYLAGMVAADRDGKTIGANDFAAQCTQVFANIELALLSAEMNWSNIVQFTSYLCRAEDVAGFGEWRKQHFPQLFGGAPDPPNTLLIVSRLADPLVLLEVQATAAR